jgi:tetratricopeptide (TPR) repeat protein
MRVTMTVALGWLLIFPVRALAQVDIIRELSHEADKTIAEMKSYKAEDVLKKIRHTMEKFAEVSEKVLSAGPEADEESVEALIEFYETAARDFRDIAEKKEEILRGVKERRKELVAMREVARNEITRIRRQLRELDMKPLPRDPMKKKFEEEQRSTLRQLYESQLRALQIWDERYGKLMEEATPIEEHIDNLLFVIEKSVPIYEESARALRMNKDLEEAIALFEKGAEVSRLTEEVIESWLQTEDIIRMALESLQEVTPLP